MTGAAPRRSSVSSRLSPLFKNAISWKRRDSVVKSNHVVSKTSVSGQNVTVVPVMVVDSPWASGAVGTPRS